MGTHPYAGRCNNRKDFQSRTFARPVKLMKPPGLIHPVLNVIGSAQGEWVPVKLVARTKK